MKLRGSKQLTELQTRTVTALERIAKSLEGGDGRILALIEREAASIDRIDTTLVRIASLLATLADQTKPPPEIAEDRAGVEPPVTTKTAG